MIKYKDKMLASYIIYIMYIYGLRNTKDNENLDIDKILYTILFNINSFRNLEKEKSIFKETFFKNKLNNYVDNLLIDNNDLFIQDIDSLSSEELKNELKGILNLFILNGEYYNEFNKLCNYAFFIGNKKRKLKQKDLLEQVIGYDNERITSIEDLLYFLEFTFLHLNKEYPEIQDFINSEKLFLEDYRDFVNNFGMCDNCYVSLNPEIEGYLINPEVGRFCSNCWYSLGFDEIK